MARDRSVAVTLKASVSDYISGMGRAKAATSDFATSSEKTSKAHSTNWANVGRAVTIGGLAIAAGVGYAISKFADFDAAMSGAGAASGATAGDLDKLRAAALEAGQATQFSATDAANAITELAKAGVSVNDILSGGLLGTLNLAAAGQLEVGKAAEIAATAMNQFKLKGADIPHIVDLLAAGAGKASGSVEDMGMALKQVGLVANQAGLSVEETTGALAAFASAGLIGSDAGTSFKTMLQRLVAPTTAAKAEMSKLGITAYDAQGNFVGLEKFSGNLRDSLKGLTVEQRNSALATIFGSDAIRAAAVLYDQGAEGVHKWMGNVNDAGFAARQAARLTDNWKGDLERLSGALETAFIKSGTGANSALRGLTQSIEGVVNWFNNLNPALQSSVVYMAAAAAGIALVGGGALIAIPKIIAFKTAVADLGLMSGKTGVALGLLGKAVAVFAVAGAAQSIADMGAAAQVASPQTEKLANGLRELASGAKESQDFGDLFRSGLGLMAGDTEKTSTALDQFAITAKKALDPGIFDGFSGASGRFAEQAKQIDEALASLVTSGSADQAKAAFDKLAEAASAQGISVEQLAAQFPQYQAALDGVTTSGQAASDSQNQTKAAVDAYTEATRAGKDATDEYVNALKGLTKPFLDADAAMIAWEDAIAKTTESLKANGATLDITTEKGRANKTALNGMAEAGIQVIATMQANGASQQQLQAQLEASRGRLVAAAMAFGMSKDQAWAYANQVLQIPAVVNTQVNANTGAAYSSVVALAQQLNSLHDREIFIRTTMITINKLDNSQGPLSGNATGGYIQGPGTATSDSILSMLSNGEYVVKAAAVEKYGVGFLHDVNSMRFADGGLVSRASAGTSNGGSMSAPVRDVKQENHYYGVTDPQQVTEKTRRDMAWTLAAS